MFVYNYITSKYYFLSRDTWDWGLSSFPSSWDLNYCSTRLKWIIVVVKNTKWMLGFNQPIYTLRRLINTNSWRHTDCLIWFGCVMSLCKAVCHHFIIAERGIGGWRAPWPPERAVTSPVIMWLHLTPSRQKSKPLHFFLTLSFICLFFFSPNTWKN